MISGSRKLFEARCVERGYTLDEVRPCIVGENADEVTVDETHPAYPRSARPPRHVIVSRPPTAGPGTELKKLLSKVGIVATPTCSCNARARAMDEQEAKEPGWCEAHTDEIVGWLREEAAKRKLPFMDVAGRILVRRAIRNAKRAS